MKINPNEPAFPVSAQSDNDGNFPTGLTIRAEFAKSAMMGLLSSPDFCNENAIRIADWSVEQADALIARLNQDEK